MALIEDLENLEMTRLEALLKECLLQRPDMTASIPDTQRQKDYVLWMIKLVENPGNRKKLWSADPGT